MKEKIRVAILVSPNSKQWTMINTQDRYILDRERQNGWKVIMSIHREFYRSGISQLNRWMKCTYGMR